MAPAGRFPFQLPATAAVALPGVYLGAAEYLGLPHPEMGPLLAALVYGVAIICGAVLLSWAAEAAQVDISAGMAIALLALLACCPSTPSTSCSRSRRARSTRSTERVWRAPMRRIPAHSPWPT